MARQLPYRVVGRIPHEKAEKNGWQIVLMENGANKRVHAVKGIVARFKDVPEDGPRSKSEGTK